MDENEIHRISEQSPVGTPESTAGTPPLGSTAEQLLSNPDLLRRIGDIVNTVSASSPPTATPPQGQSAATPSVTNFDGSIPMDGLSAILSNPAMLEKLPQMMAMLKPMMASMTPAPAASTGEPRREKSMADCRDDLLCALKPFLSPERCEAVDSIIRIAKLGIVLKQLK
ncbi:MAG: hypothetical protein IJX62_05525 [Clostridia bacterium]|nr:hypothetical protein [Clostridia bacterium]